MTAYHATTTRLNKRMEAGIRPFDIGCDLRPVAELIADAFAHELDQRGNAALREMRIMSHIGALLKLLNHSTGEFNDLFGGFVWVEDGKVVGNVTVQKADSTGNRWQIANVAVAPAYRGRGISRRLMSKALEYVAESHGEWAVLQVYAQNKIARHLYEQLNFEEVGGSVDLTLKRLPKVEMLAPAPYFHSFSADQWQALYELVSNQQSGQMQWWRAPRRTDYQITLEQMIGEWFWRTIGSNRIYRRCIQTTRRFDAALILTVARWRGAHQLQLWVQPNLAGQHEETLLNWTLATLQEYPRWPVNLNLSLSQEAALACAKAYGFQEQQTLLTMRCRI
ncbi:MAG: GNAT family N-acetyltransferase [Caldilineaceae bacterium]|nr:GNAT family N-acetyltransferase [Caldilineaceae bacterium]